MMKVKLEKNNECETQLKLLLINTVRNVCENEINAL